MVHNIIIAVLFPVCYCFNWVATILGNLRFYWIKSNPKSKWPRMPSICLFISQSFASGTEQANREIYPLFSLVFWYCIPFHMFLTRLDSRFYNFWCFELDTVYSVYSISLSIECHCNVFFVYLPCFFSLTRCLIALWWPLFLSRPLLTTFPPLPAYHGPQLADMVWSRHYVNIKCLILSLSRFMVDSHSTD